MFFATPAPVAPQGEGSLSVLHVIDAQREVREEQLGDDKLVRLKSPANTGITDSSEKAARANKRISIVDVIDDGREMWEVRLGGDKAALLNGLSQVVSQDGKEATLSTKSAFDGNPLDDGFYEVSASPLPPPTLGQG